MGIVPVSSSFGREGGGRMGRKRAAPHAFDGAEIERCEFPENAREGCRLQ